MLLFLDKEVVAGGAGVVGLRTQNVDKNARESAASILVARSVCRKSYYRAVIIRGSGAS